MSFNCFVDLLRLFIWLSFFGLGSLAWDRRLGIMGLGNLGSWAWGTGLLRLGSPVLPAGRQLGDPGRAAGSTSSLDIK